MKILLKGYYGFGNFGDDILMIIAFGILKEKFPGAEFFVFSNYTQNLKEFEGEGNYNHYIFDLLGARPTLIDWTYQGYFDLIFSGGGGVYFDDRNASSLFLVLNGLYEKIGVHNLYRASEFLRKLVNKQRRIQSKKRVGFGIGLGSYAKKSAQLGRDLADIGGHETLFVRDAKSAKFLAKFGFRGNTSLGTDMAFLSEYWNTSIDLDLNRKFSGRLCIVLQDWPLQREKKFKTIIDFASAMQAEQITFLSFDKNQDKDYARLVSGKYKFLAWDPHTMSVTEFVNEIASHDIIITGRAHGAIIGAMAGVIPICLGTSQKLVEVSKYFPTGGILLSNNFTKEELLSCCEKVGQHYNEYVKHLREEVNANVLIALRDKEKLFELL